MNMQKYRYSFFPLGFVTLIAGIALVLAWWPAVVGLFKGLSGMVLAVAGLLLLYFAEKR